MSAEKISPRPSDHCGDDTISKRIRASRLADLITQLRWILGAALVLILLVVLWPRPTASVPEGVTEIHLWVPNGASGLMRDALDAFEAAHPEYHVVAGNSQLRDATSDPQRFLCGVAGGVPPDVIWFDRYAVVEWAVRGMFHPLDEYIAREQAEYDRLLREIARAREQEDQQRIEELEVAEGRLVVPELFYEACWNEAYYQHPADAQPRQWAIPSTMDARAMFVVDRLLRRAGLVYKEDDPDVTAGKANAGDVRPPSSWEELCTKKLEGHAGRLTGGRVLTCDSVNFNNAHIQPGDHVSLDYDAKPTLARVSRVTNEHEIEVEPLFTGKQRPDEPETINFKVYDPRSYAIKLTEWDETGRILTLGFAPISESYDNSFLYLYAWQAGGRFFSNERQFDDPPEPGDTEQPRCTLDHPRIAGALEWVVDCFDALGGYEAIRGFESSYQRGRLDPMLNGKLAMVVNLDGVINDLIAQFDPAMDFTVIPAPLPQAEMDAGRKPITWSGGWAYAIPKTAKNKEAAWKLIKWLVSDDWFRRQNQIQSDIQRSLGRLYIPRMCVRRRTNEWFYDFYVENNDLIPPRIKSGQREFVELLSAAYIPPVSPVGQILWQECNRALERSATYGDRHEPPGKSLAISRRIIDEHLDRVLAPPSGREVKWKPFIGVYLALIVALGAILGVRHRRANRSRGLRGKEWYAGLVCASPWIIGFIVFIGGPILFSVVMSFTRYDVVNPGHWVGLDNYRELAHDPLVGISLWNTVVMALSVPLGLIVGLAIAMLLDTGVRGLAGYRTIYYLPAIVPMVAASILWIWVFNVQDGLLNGLVARAGMENAVGWALGPFGIDVPVKWLQSAETSKAALIIMALWGAGAGMLIWLAGLKSIATHLYEAAAIDGAGPVRRFFHVTLPMLSPYIFFNLVMGTIAVFQIFTQAYIMTRGGPSDSTLFFAYNLFNQAFRLLRMGYAAALAWVLFAIIMLLTLINLAMSKRWVHYESP